jgi:LCP family protein required for cell wall assembly
MSGSYAEVIDGRPAPQRAPRRTRWPRVLLVVGLTLVLVAGLAAVGVRLLAERLDRTVTRAQLLDTTARSGQATPDGPLNFLLIGSDLRVSNPSMGQRSDTIVVVHVPADRRHAYLVSLPRDLLVQIPADPAAGYAGGSDKINAAFQLGGAGVGGARLLSATVTALTGVRFDGAAIVDFAGFRRVVDLIGGIRVCVDQPVTSIHTDRVFPVGCQDMDGAAALDYARQRYDLPDGDFDRQRHQQQILKAIADKVGSAGVLGNPIKLDQLVRAVAATLTVDLGGADLDRLVFALRDLRPDDLVGVAVPSRVDDVDGTSYVLLDPAADALFRGMRDATMPGWVAANPRWVNAL